MLQLCSAIHVPPMIQQLGLMVELVTIITPLVQSTLQNSSSTPSAWIFTQTLVSEDYGP
jgi:hypothetical protein